MTKNKRQRRHILGLLLLAVAALSKGPHSALRPCCLLAYFVAMRYNDRIMESPDYAAYVERFGAEPEPHLQQLSLAQLRCIAKELGIEFFPPFKQDDPTDIVRSSIINAAIADFEKPEDIGELIDAVEKCMR